MGHVSDNALRGGDLVDRAKLFLERLKTELFDPGTVHETRVQVADFLIGRTRGSAFDGTGLFDDSLQMDLRRIQQIDKTSGIRLVGRDVRGREPCAVDIPEQVVLRPHRRVHRGDVDTEFSMPVGGLTCR